MVRKHTTNYINTFIEIADDCSTDKGEKPPLKGNEPTIAGLQFEMVKNNPYKYTSDEVIFEVFAARNNINDRDKKEEWDLFYSKGQACLRSSPLTKRYGWGIHHNEEGRIALYSAGSVEYNNFIKNPEINKVRAMRSARKKK